MSNMIGTFYDNQAVLLDAGINAGLMIYLLEQESKEERAIISELEAHLAKIKQFASSVSSLKAA